MANPKSWSARTVSMMTGIAAKSGSSLSRESTTHPSISGMRTSECNNRWAQFPGEPQSFSAAGGKLESVTLVESVCEQLMHGWIVINDEDSTARATLSAGPAGATVTAPTVRGAMAGSSMVKIEPFPGSLATEISPPII